MPTKNTRERPSWNDGVIYLSLDLDLGEDLLSGVLGDTAGDRQVGVLLEVKINLTSSLATFVDTPDETVSFWFTLENRC